MAKSKAQEEIPLHGSLGLLALGARGLRAWRQRKAMENKQEQNGKD